MKIAEKCIDVRENGFIAYAVTQAQISYAALVTAQLISAFVFVTRTVQFHLYLYQKFLLVGMCRTWSEIPKTVCLALRLTRI